MAMKSITPAIGSVFGRLTVIGEAPKHILPCGQSQNKSLCVCECGKKVEIINRNLRDGLSKSCGCLAAEMAAFRNTKHGHNKRGIHPTPTYVSWCNMVQRCTNPNHPKFERYGMRGVSVCTDWLDFRNFLNDMGEKPPKTSIGRKDNNLGYSKSNCRWETDIQQARNKSTNRIVTVRGITASLSELCEKFGTSYHLVKRRLNTGWTPEDAFFAKVRYCSRHIA